MKLSDYVLSFLLKKVKKVFLINGAIYLWLMLFQEIKNKYISAAHEQGAAMMADAYSRLGPNLYATMVTSGLLR